MKAKLENYPKNATLKNLISKMKNLMESLTSWVTATKDQISKLEDDVQKTTRQ